MFVALSYILNNFQLRLLSYGARVLLGQIARSSRLVRSAARRLR